MNNAYINLSGSFSFTDNKVQTPTYYLKGSTTLAIALTGVKENDFKVDMVEIDWGDGSKQEVYKRDVLFNYSTQSILNEVLLGQIGGGPLGIYYHDYASQHNTYDTNYFVEVSLHKNNGKYTTLQIPIKVLWGSYYDDIGRLKILDTQIQPLTSNNTFANLESKNNKTVYISTLSEKGNPLSYYPYNYLRTNLLLDLDAGDPLSYPGYGTTWFDRTDFKNDFTLKGTSYDISNGSIKFNRNMPPLPESEVYATRTTTGLLSAQTYLNNDHTTEVWARINSLQPYNSLSASTEHFSTLLTFRGYHSMFAYDNTFLTYGMFTLSGASYLYASVSYSSLSLHVGKWTHYVGIRRGSALEMYVNGELKTSATLANLSYPIFTGQSVSTLKMGQTNPPSSSETWSGDNNIGAVRMYNRALTPAEVKHNFNTLRSRYGI